VQRFGYPGASRGSAAFPQLRFVALVECGTHVLCHAQFGPYAHSEVALARKVLPYLDASMLLLADRGFFSHDLWQRAASTGAKLLFRVRRIQRLPREQALADGSYLTTLYANDQDRRQRRHGRVVRVIEYTLHGIPIPNRAIGWSPIGSTPRPRRPPNWLPSTISAGRSSRCSMN
jgi:hypothetical protein